MSNTAGSGNWNDSGRNKGGGGFRGRGRKGNKFWRGKSNFRGGQGGGKGFKSGGGGPGGNRYDNYKCKNEDRQPKREMPSKRLSEDVIGVTEYVSDHEGFSGIIKSRYSDFQVAEISDRGEIAKLTDMSPPSPPAEEAVVEDEYLLINKYNLEILPTETWDEINKLAVAKSTKEVVEIDVSVVSKEQRTKIHDAVKKAFGENIVGSTINIDNKKLIRFEKFQKGVRIDNRVKWVWPAEYTYFVVHKENCDTMEAAVKIAERLRLNIKPSMLGYAGTKDRRAKTSQWFSLRKVDPRRVAAACRHMREIKLGNYAFREHSLRLGKLSGNQFRIVLRNVTSPEDTVNTACEYLKQNGFINYYGLQRFGTRAEIPTYQIGLKLLQGNLRQAIDDILAERPGPLSRALSAYKRGGAAAALREWPPRPVHNALMELRLLKALAKSPNDLYGALEKLARNSRLLYLHAYQSLVWNLAVSERARRYGLRPAVGDLVPEDIRFQEPVEAMDIIEDVETEDLIDDTESSEENTTETPLETSIKQEQTKIPVRVLTQEDVDNNKYSIFDIIMPLPGHLIEYPPNMKQFYVDKLTADGLTLEMRHKYKNYTMSGAYRHMVVRPVNFSWSLVRYSDPTADLILSDWDELNGKQIRGIVPDGEYKALLLTMNLPASCYATMALRELLKVDTACDFQAQQNMYYKKKDETTDSHEHNESEITQDNIKKEEVKVKTEKVDAENAKVTDDSIKKEENDAEDAKVKEESIKKNEVEAEDRKVSEESVKKEIKDEINKSHAEKRKINDESVEVDAKRIKEESDSLQIDIDKVKKEIESEEMDVQNIKETDKD